MKKWLAVLVTALLTTNFLLLVVAAFGAISAVVVLFQLTALLG